MITAFVTIGEGYHNFHHQFPMDYRNAVKWYQYDPTKWFIRVMQQLGLEERGPTAIDLVVEASGAEVSIQTGILIAKHGGSFVQVRLRPLLRAIVV